MSLITVSTEDAAFPKANLIDKDYANPFRFTVTTGGTIEIDFLAPVVFDAVFIGNHNFDPTVALTIKVGAASPPTTLIDSPAYRAKNIISTFTSQTFRFLEVGITDAGSDTTEIGELVVGVRTVLPRSHQFGFVPGIQQAVVLDRTNRGRRYAVELFQLERRAYVIRFLESERSQILNFWNSVNGSLDPFVWMEDNIEDDPAESLYVSLENPGYFPQQLAAGGLDPAFDFQFTVIEESTGAAILT